MLHNQTAVSPRALVQEAQKCRSLCSAERDKEVSNLADYFFDVIQVFDPKLRGVSFRDIFLKKFMF
jgi:hypothetical protein